MTLWNKFLKKLFEIYLNKLTRFKKRKEFNFTLIIYLGLICLIYIYEVINNVENMRGLLVELYLLHEHLEI
jgi:hypothetical protein